MYCFEDKEYLILRGAIYQDLFNDKKFTDVVIETNDGTQFPCHKIILMGGCPFFKGLFSSEMIECQQKVINFKKIDISGPHFKQILEYIYSGKVELNFEDAIFINIYSGLFTMKKLEQFSENCLIENIGTQTCLKLWRHAEKYLNDNLKDSCMIVASTKEFLDIHIQDLTLEELKSIASLNKLNCTSKTLLENIVKWLKLDFENRRPHIKDLMELINFDNIEDEYKRKVFSDELLIESKTFLTLTVKCLLSQLRKKKLFVLTNEKVFYTNFDTKECKPTIMLCPTSKYFAMSRHTRSGFVTTGGHQNNRSENVCKQFCPNSSEIIEFPPLITARYHHKNYTLGNKIYACGGFNAKTVEMFEANAGKWTTGPDMNDKRYNFGSADDSENSLYAVGGTNPNLSIRETKPIFLDSIAHLDTRTKNWQTIYNDSSIALGFTQSLYKDSQIYGFGINEGYIFDIRANKKLLTIPYELNKFFKFTQQCENYYDCTFVEDDICIVGKMCVNNTAESSSSIIKFDLKTNTWDRQIFKGLPSTPILGLIWCNNN